MSKPPAGPQPADRTLTSVADRRVHQRFTGPFDGLRVEALETPIRIYDLSRGGCFVTAMHAQKAGIRLTLRLDLPPEGWITVVAETLDRHDEVGFAVRFISMDPDDAVRFDRALARLAAREAERP
jgi:hypothetical protein